MVQAHCDALMAGRRDRQAAQQVGASLREPFAHRDAGQLRFFLS